MSGDIKDEKKVSKRKKRTSNKRWLQSDEAAIISFIKQNPDFEKPTAQVYYNKFLFESEIDTDWDRVRHKMRHMRRIYRKAKEYGIKKAASNDLYKDYESVRKEMLRICWYLDDFDIIFPHEMETHSDGMYLNAFAPSCDEVSNEASFSNIKNTSTDSNEKYLLDEPAMSLSSSSIKKDILAVQTGMFNFKRQQHGETTTIKQQELELLREQIKLDREKFNFDKEKFCFEKEKFREELKIKDKEIESQEKLKIMEIQMKERVALKELELKERIAFKSVEKHENYTNLYNDIKHQNMSASKRRSKLMPLRYRTKPIKKWTLSEEITLINYLKNNRNFEKPVARVYYNKFLEENNIDDKSIDFKVVRSKVRNMRVRYRTAKECEIKKSACNDSEFNAEDIRKEMLKICWYIDDFDDIFPNEMDGYIYKKPQADIFFNQESSSNINNSTQFLNEDTCSDQEPPFKFNTSKPISTENLFREDDLTSSSSSNSINGDVITKQEDIFNFKTQHHKDTSIRQQEIELLKEKLSFEKEKFRQEFTLKEKELESQERLKIMELQMKERLAMKELELKERLALKSMEKRETSSLNNVYHNLV
ncbi:uncharacterized protein LOC119601695 [Lucilia sericata]|uniref:uncharacterized protein LOC119601695 n=1 Tax=Lucilia sericata TaxID=13632 RepID=UPI0018A82D90|nr:uncharacterized protein LOC119601695 [Lucilia sericata]